MTFVYPKWSGPAELLTIWNVLLDQGSLLHKLTLAEEEVEEFLKKYSDGLNDSSNVRGWNYRVVR